MAFLTSAFFFVTWLPQISALTQCYKPDGSPVHPDYQPCHPGRQSICCATNRLNNPYQNKCRPDDLCLEEASQAVWRESCTNPTWKDPACLPLCISGNAFDPAKGFSNMTQNDVYITLCGYGSYCCGYNNTGCCTSGQGFWVSNGQVYPYNLSPFTTVSTLTTQFTASTTSTPSSNVNSGNNSDSSTKIALGVGLGIGIPIILLLIAVVLVLLKQRSRIVTPDMIGASAAATLDTTMSHTIGTMNNQDPKLVIPNRPELEASIN